MGYLYLVGAVALAASNSIFCGFYNRKNATKSNAAALYNLIFHACALLFWAIYWAVDYSFDADVIWYGLGFGACFVCASVGIVFGMKTGPIMLTSLIFQLALIAPAIWGFFFWETPFTWLVATGLVLVIAAIFLCLYKGKSAGKSAKITPQWLIFVALAFIGNAGCSIIQKEQQIRFSEQHGNFMMVVGMALATAVFLAMFLQASKKEMFNTLKTTGYFPLCSGLANAGQNLLVILLASTALSPSLIYPVIGVGGLAIVTVFSLFVFKEKMAWWQWLGVALGAAAVVFLSI